MLEFLEKCSMPYLGFFLLFIGKLESKYNSNIYTYYYSNTNVAQISINCHWQWNVTKWTPFKNLRRIPQA